MRYSIITIAIVLLAILGSFIFFLQKSRHQIQTIIPSNTISEKKTKMKLESSSFPNNQSIPQKYTCDGENINPPLSISDVPQDTKSLVLILDDPDAPSGTWTHWTLWNINPQFKELAEKSIPEGAIEGKTSFGKPGYKGPCPPSGTHRYVFKLYALDTILTLDQNTNREELDKIMINHILDRVEFIGLYKKQ